MSDKKAVNCSRCGRFVGHDGFIGDGVVPACGRCCRLALNKMWIQDEPSPFVKIRQAKQGLI